MKNIILIAILFFTMSCNAQIYDLNDPTISKSSVPNGTYFKDLNGTLNPYIGMWKADWNGKTIYLHLKKIKYKMQDLNGDFIYADRIFGERKIINANGVVEVDRITNFDNNSPEFMGIVRSLAHTDYQTISFYPKNMCNKKANLDVKFLNPQKTQMQMKFRFEPSFLKENCQYYNLIISGGDLPINFPKEDIVFTKQ